MGIVVKYKTNDPETRVTRLSFLFNGEPGVIAWHPDTKLYENDGIVTLTCYNLRHSDGKPITDDMMGDITLIGGLWFDKNSNAYGSSVEFLSAQFFGIGGHNYDVKIGVDKSCGTQ